MSLFAKRLPAGRWSFFGLGSETEWYSTYNERPRGEWDRVAELMMITFRESGHPVFRATSPLSRGTLKSKGGGKLSIHCCADGDTIETVFITIISVNQLSIHGAVSRALMKNSISQRERYFSPLDVEMIDQLSTLEVLCPRVQWIMRHLFRQREVQYSMNLECVG